MMKQADETSDTTIRALLLHFFDSSSISWTKEKVNVDYMYFFARSLCMLTGYTGYIQAAPRSCEIGTPRLVGLINEHYQFEAGTEYVYTRKTNMTKGHGIDRLVEDFYFRYKLNLFYEVIASPPADERS